MNKHYSNVLKERVVKKYLEDAKMNGLVLQYELADKSRIRKWQDQFYSMAVFQTIEEPEKAEGTAKCGYVHHDARRIYTVFGNGERHFKTPTLIFTRKQLRLRLMPVNAQYQRCADI
jgi:hypothetical protein